MSWAWTFERFGLENLQRVPRPVVEPGPGEVRLRITATSLNYRDLLMVRGHYDPRMALPLVPCSDGVGIVEAIGSGVDVELGARRAALFTERWSSGAPREQHLRETRGGPLPGMLQSHIVLPAAATVPVPEGLSDVEAATLPCAGVTAWHALQACGVTAGSRVLTLGTGGVSLFALQLAKAMGACVAITSSSDEKLERARGLGADFTLNYRKEPRWGRAIRAWAPDGVDGVVEVGGTGTLAQSLRAVRVGGTIALIGVLDGGSGEVPLVNALMRSVRIQGIFVGHAEHATTLARAVTTHGIRPVIDGVFPFEAAPEAFARLASGAHFGKVVVSSILGP